MISELKMILKAVKERVPELRLTHWHTGREIGREQYPALLLDETAQHFERIAQGNLYHCRLRFDGYLLYSDEDADSAFEGLLEQVLEAFLEIPDYMAKEISALRVALLEISAQKVLSAWFQFEFLRRQQW